MRGPSPSRAATLEDGLQFSPRILLTHRNRLCLCACLFVTNCQEPIGKSPQASSCRVSWLPWTRCLLSWQQTQLQLPSQGPGSKTLKSPSISRVCGAWEGDRNVLHLLQAYLLRLPTSSFHHLKAFSYLLTGFSLGQKRQAADLSSATSPGIEKRTRRRPGLKTGSASTWLCDLMSDCRPELRVVSYYTILGQKASSFQLLCLSPGPRRLCKGDLLNAFTVSVLIFSVAL